MTDRTKKLNLLGEISDTTPKKKNATFLGRTTFGPLLPIDTNRLNMADFLQQLGDPVESRTARIFNPHIRASKHLPHSEPGKTNPFWERRNGDFSLVIENGYKPDNTGKRKPVGHDAMVILRG